MHGVQVVDVNRPVPVALASRHVERVAVLARALGIAAFDQLDADARRSLQNRSADRRLGQFVPFDHLGEAECMPVPGDLRV